MNNEHAGDSGFIPLDVQEELAASIVEDANGRPFSLARIGPYDYFPEYYSQNYQFLIRKQGGNIDQSAKLKYVIYDAGPIYFQKNE